MPCKLSRTSGAASGPPADSLSHGQGVSSDNSEPLNLICQEVEWRVPPPPLRLTNGQQLRVRLSRWTDVQHRGTRELCSDAEDDSHVLTIVLRRTKGELLIGGKSVWTGGAPGELLMTG